MPGMVGMPAKFEPKMFAEPNVGNVVLGGVPVKGVDPNRGALVLSGSSEGLEVTAGVLVVLGLVAWIVFEGPNVSGVVFG